MYSVLNAAYPSKWNMPELKKSRACNGSSERKRRGIDMQALQPSGRRIAGRRGKRNAPHRVRDYMKRKMNTVNKRLVFVIGGAVWFLAQSISGT